MIVSWYHEVYGIEEYNHVSDTICNGCKGLLKGLLILHHILVMTSVAIPSYPFVVDLYLLAIMTFWGHYVLSLLMVFVPM